MKCKACLSDSLLKTDSTKDGVIFKCKLCGSKYIKLYQTNINKNSEYGEAYRYNLSKEKAKELLSIFLQFVDEKGKKLLDIGCGSGDFIKAIKNEGWDVSGLDADKEAIKLIKAEGINAIYGILGEHVSNLHEKFDVITLWDLIEHIENIENSVEWISDHLEQQGRIIIVTPDANSLLDSFANLEKTVSFGKSKMLLEICLNQYHLNRFSSIGLKTLFSRYNIFVEKIIPINLFSLKPETYFDGFAPGINKLTNYSRFNKLISKAGIFSTKLFRIKNKLLFIGVKK